MGGARGMYGERLYTGFSGEIEGKRPLGRPKCRWEDNIKMDLQEVGCGGMDRFDLAEYGGRSQALATFLSKKLLHWQNSVC